MAAYGYGILGGTFNPIHYGHLRAAEQVRGRLDLEKVIFIPAGTPPLKDIELVDVAQRLRMTGLATESNPYFEVSDVECRKKGKSYTVETVRELKEKDPHTEFVFILGIDAFLDLPHWKEPEKLLTLVDFAVISRPESSFMDISRSPLVRVDRDVLSRLDDGRLSLHEATLEGGRRLRLLGIRALNISATEIRDLRRRGGSIKYLLPEPVESFIITNRLYI